VLSTALEKHGFPKAFALAEIESQDSSIPLAAE
jgi:hypothetical protein